MDEFDDAFRSYLAAAYTFEHHPEFPDTPWKLKIEVDPPATLSVILGEAVQNIRTALDYLVHELAIHAGAKKSALRKTQFPISTSATKYFERGRYQVRPLLGEHRRRIRKLQPYQAEADAKTHSLAVLNRLSNTDKHRLLLTVLSQAPGISMKLKVENGRPVIIGTKALALPTYLQGTKKLEEIRGRNPDLGGVLWVDLGLESENRASAFDTLNRLLAEVTEIIDGFVPVFGEE